MEAAERYNFDLYYSPKDQNILREQYWKEHINNKATLSFELWQSSVASQTCNDTSSKEVKLLELFSNGFCSELKDQFLKAPPYCPKPSKLGVSLYEFGFSSVCTKFALETLTPLIRTNFPHCFTNEFEGAFVTDYYAYIIGYSATSAAPKHHEKHTDDSDFTVNVCLSTGFQGCDLIFHPNKEVSISVPQRIGWAAIHLGNVQHEAKPILAGERFNLILWLKRQRVFPKFTFLPNDLIGEIVSKMKLSDALRFFCANKFCKEFSSSSSKSSLILLRKLLQNNGIMMVSNMSPEIDLIYELRKHHLDHIEKRSAKLAMLFKEVLETEINAQQIYFRPIIEGFKLLEGLLENKKGHHDALVLCRDCSAAAHNMLKLSERMTSWLRMESNRPENLVAIYEHIVFDFLCYRPYNLAYTLLQAKIDSDSKLKKILADNALHLQSVFHGHNLTFENYAHAPLRRVPRHLLLFSELMRHLRQSRQNPEIITNFNEVCRKLNPPHL